MRIPKFTLRVISIAMCLFLLSIGMVPAQTFCDGTCNCSSKGLKHDMVSMPKGVSNHHLKEPKFTHFLKIDFSDMGCHENTTKSSCDMEAPRHRDVIQGPIPAGHWSKNSSTIDSILVVSLIHSNEQNFINPAVSNWVLGRRAPDPLYIQYLSFRC